MPRHRRHSIAFKRQVAEKYHAGASLYGLVRAHDVCCNLIRVWLEKYEAGEFDEEVDAANMLHEYEARIAAFERLVGKQALEIEFLKGGLRTRDGRREAGLHPRSPARGLSVARGYELMSVSRWSRPKEDRGATGRSPPADAALRRPPRMLPRQRPRSARSARPMLRDAAMAGER